MLSVIILFLISFVFVANAAPAGQNESEKNDIKISVIDQRQTGDYNVHVNLENIQITALLGGGDTYSDYDYNYDYSELTIKPQNATSTTPIIFITNESTTSAANCSTTTSPTTVTSARELPKTTEKGTPKLSNYSSNNTTPMKMEVTTQKVVEITPPKREGIQSTTPFPVSNNVEIITEMTQTPVTVVVLTTASPLTESNSTNKERIPESNTTVAEQTHGGIVCQKGYMRNKKGECELRVKPSQDNTLRKLVELSQRLKLRKVK